jgi:ubiquinone/menaquinone biosynthesis C-methylase UbiE
MPEASSVFTGSIPENYDRYLGPLIFEDYAVDLAERTAALRPARVLETAAGTGIVSRRLRERLAPETRLVVTDLSPDMLGHARRKLEGAAGVEFQPADATALPFPDAAFDAVVCQFGIMFFPDKLRGVREAARVLRPGGALLFNVWDSLAHNDLVRTLVAEVADVLGGAPTFFDVPYGWYALDPIKALLEAAGFGQIAISVVPRPCRCNAARDVATGFISGTPFSLELARRSALAPAEAIARVGRGIARAHGDPPAAAKMQAIVVTARRA